ncbi:WD repeat-containing protein 74 [Nilaparvata lugens]|uniref:WD repeat-containing protein 74 n=1 Tax=Nilaparvata lugens TaxID=108931 RepID=UPI000B98DCFB|nr:WD repeat-containing protein 74 [Nilaparvata lugens]
MIERQYNVYVGGTTGVFKGLRISHSGLKKTTNLVDVKEVSNKREITCMNWSMADSSQIVMGYCDQTVRMYDTAAHGFVFDNKLNCGQGSIVGVSSHNNALITAAKSGEVKIWNTVRDKVEETLLIKSGGELDRMCHSRFDVNCIATGGKENDLKLWDVETGASKFSAKNVRPDELELRVPVWVSDLTFMPDTPKVAVASRYGFVRLYDPSSSFRRPVINLKVPDQAFTCISTCPRENHVLVGSGTGHMFLVDLRGKGLLLNHYKGFVGGVRHIACPPLEPLVVTVGLDRHIRVHDLNTKQLLLKEYLQSRLTSVLLTPGFTMVKVKEEEEEEEVEIKIEEGEVKKEEEDGDQDLDAMFDGMPTVTDAKKSRKVAKLDVEVKSEDVKKSRKVAKLDVEDVKKRKIVKKMKSKDSVLCDRSVKKKKVK